jgi:hypothetical protein
MHNDKIILIGLVGLKGSGKDTMADIFVQNHGFVKRSYADPLKEACKALFTLDDAQLWGELKEVKDERWDGCTPRQILQFVGSDLLRDQLHEIMPTIGKTIHVHNMKLWLDENLPKHQRVIIPDCRFKNEIDLIKSMGGTIIKINREVITNKVRKLLEESESESDSDSESNVESNNTSKEKTLALHQSEVALFNFTEYDYLFENREGQMDALTQFVTSWISKHET